MQSNWKVSEHWTKQKSEQQLEELLASMRERFDADGSVFKQTKGAGQLLKQGEIDIVGIGQDGSVHAVDVAFHEAGLNYAGGTAQTVLKKLLRLVLILRTYHPEETKLHVYFVSPKVNPREQNTLEDVFDKLKEGYAEIEWHLLTNDLFASQVVQPTLDRARSVADTSELFVRAAKLLELAGSGDAAAVPRRTSQETTTSDGGQIQPLVKNLMGTLLEDYPTLLDASDLLNMADVEHCNKVLGLRIGNHPLLRLRQEGSHRRYYAKVYGDKFYVCSQWWKADHFHNAESLVRFVTGLIKRQQGHAGTAALEKHWAAFQEFVG